MTVDLRSYPGYKESGVPWLGRIPRHWDCLPHRALFEEIKEQGHGDEPLLSVTISRGIIRQEDLLANSSKKDSSNLDKSKYKLVEPGDIAYNKMRAWQGAVGVSRYWGIVSPAYIVQRVRNEHKPEFFHYLFRTPGFAKEAERWSYGITSDQWSLRPQHFKMIYSCVPPKDEQDAIVRFLKSFDRNIRRYIRNRRRLIEVLNEQKQIITNRAVTRGIDHDVSLKPSGIDWLGDIPEHWEVRRAKTICSAIVDCKNRTPEFIENGLYTVVRTTCIKNGQFDPRGGYNTDERNYLVWTARGAPRSGDVFFTREAPAGEACLVPNRDDLCMGQRMMYFRPNTDLLDAEFLLLNIYGPLTKNHIELTTNGSTVGHLRLGQVYGLPLSWCPLNEQRAIVEYVKNLTRPIDSALQISHREIDMIQEYRKRLISDVVTGKVDVRHLSSNPGSKDLEELSEALESLDDLNAEAMDAEASHADN